MIIRCLDESTEEDMKDEEYENEEDESEK